MAVASPPAQSSKCKLEEGKWHGRPNFYCTACAFSTLHEEAARHRKKNCAGRP